MRPGCQIRNTGRSPRIGNLRRLGWLAGMILIAVGSDGTSVFGATDPAETEPVAQLAPVDTNVPPEVSTTRRQGSDSPLPPIDLAPAKNSPPSGSTLPPVPQAPAAQAPLNQAPSFVLREVRLEGNTCLDRQSVDGIVGPYLNKPVSLADLEEIRRQLTSSYIEKGYINSGVLIPDQNVTDGVVVMRAVEGRVTDIDVTGTDHFKTEYFQSRLADAIQSPFNVRDVEAEQQILLQDPLVRRLNIELEPSLTPGEARLNADVLEGNPFSLTASVANDQSPTVGEIRGQLQGTAANLLGYGDILMAQYGRSNGLNDGAASYSIPIAADDTRLNLRYDRNATLVINSALSPLNITSESQTISVGLSRPFFRTPEESLTVGVNAERRSAETFLLGMPFAFSTGTNNGTTDITVLRFYQDWLDRNADHALDLRSTISLGVNLFGTTITPEQPTSKFTAWLGQAQYVHRVFDDWEAVVRSDLQLSNRSLFPLEQFPLGGIDTVRGYREYLTVTDDAFFASGELRIPIGKLPLPYISQGDEAGTVQFVPFYDYGRGWNVDRPTPYPPDISGVGAGFRWFPGAGITAELYYAKALRHVSLGTSLEDRGIYFRLTTSLY
jgi:hemolysin activation/secretion protein